ncbi:Uncharacterized conserved protein [Pseudomonas sp. NFIX10]|uniref:SphA family protein n=1 Tax=unclassified Pseudomonas TaxID=196821 RepID=UPI0008EBEF6B|nr:MULTISPECIES: transporter [unclassified Pseudomonas]SFA92411.1 Uncharacterized conserved protein [Pseudomonas sp. NFIX10]SFE37790.1 Uncharacterized conserved protein [Pseudomonas sp. NFACC06-1]
MRTKDVYLKWLAMGYVAFVSSADVYATEQGSLSYPLGVSTVMGGAYPAAGETWFLNYTQVYTSKKFADGNGHNVVPGFDANVVADAMRFAHSWNIDMKGFGVSSVLTVPVVHTDIGNSFGKEKNTGVANVGLEPFDLTWASADHSVFGYAGVAIYIPTGSNVSNSYYSFVPLSTVTWFPTPKVEVSGSVGVEFHTKNSDTDYQSGPVAFVEYGIGYHAFDSVPKLSIGLGGYATKQIADDRLDGETFGDGFRQQVVAVGPHITYGDSKGGVTAKWLHEFEGENRPVGDRFYVQFMLPFK